MDVEPKPDEPAEPVDEGAPQEDAETQHRREALADLLEQIELHGDL
jgi:hypothetical protein